MKEESAFPHYTGNESNWQFGMTLRDWFAGQAMAAIIGKTPLYGTNNITEKTHRPTAIGKEYEIMDSVAYGAYGYADAMIKARNKGKGE